MTLSNRSTENRRVENAETKRGIIKKIYIYGHNPLNEKLNQPVNGLIGPDILLLKFCFKSMALTLIIFQFLHRSTK